MAAISCGYLGEEALARAVESLTVAGAAPRTSSASTLSNLAVQGLFGAFGHSLSNLDTQGGLQDARATDLADLSRRLSETADAFGHVLRAEKRPNNQFALYNLAYPSRFPQFLKLIDPGAFFDDGDKKQSVSVNRLAEAVCEFRTKILNFAAHEDGEESRDTGKKITSTLTKYFNRQNLAMNERGHYGFVLLFHLGLARQMGFDFERCEVLLASPAIRGIFRDGLVVLQSDGATPEALLAKTIEALERGQARRDSTVFLGGLTEVGKADFRALWEPLFGESKSNHKALAHDTSRQRHFVCYRLTSSIESLEILKSFMVLQSPGRLRDEPHNWRKHFAVKVFTRYDRTLVRSVGAVMQLGDEIVGFASRREMQPQDYKMDRKPEWLDPTTFRGATMLAFGKSWFGTQRGLLLGMLTTTNQNRRNISSPVLCIETDQDHSDQVDLDVIMKEDLVKDVLKHTRLQADDTAQVGELTEYLWDMLWSTHQDRIEWGDEAQGRQKFPPVMVKALDPGSVRRRLERLGFRLEA